MARLLALLLLLALGACAQAPLRADDPCASEGSYACQVKRYHDTC